MMGSDMKYVLTLAIVALLVGGCGSYAEYQYKPYQPFGHQGDGYLGFGHKGFGHAGVWRGY
jgi:hypothetical protein|tara:strand:+ start:278 stop:460 length:183 start_codon:yes stop_codon:yes gene_type:complete